MTRGKTGPKTTISTRGKHLGAWVSLTVHRRLARIAAARQRSISFLVREAVDAYLEKSEIK